MSTRRAIVPQGIEFIEPDPSAQQLSLEMDRFNKWARKVIINEFAIAPEDFAPDLYRCLIPGCWLRAMGRRTKQFCPDHMARCGREERAVILTGWRRQRGIHVHKARPLNWEGL